MFDKVSLTEQTILSTEVSKYVPINYDKVNILALESYYHKNVQNNKTDSYLNNYLNLDHDKNITWIADFIRDHYNLKYKKIPVLLYQAGIVVPQGGQINYHHHIDEYDLLNNSSDISAIVTCKTGDKSSFIQFEYEQGRKRHHTYRKQLKEKEVVIFNSELRHCYTVNPNQEPNIILSFRFQLV
tara:strand:+ start:549 stop:1100 length:552 start_codon:yes stop_codon:yes gene_type:complete